MKKIKILVFVMSFSISAFSQLSGDIVKDGRKLLTQQSFEMGGHLNGKIIFEIAVDAKGEISSAKILDNESTIKSTPAKIKAYNYVTGFKFEPGTWFPKFHQGRIEITMVKE